MTAHSTDTAEELSVLRREVRELLARWDFPPRCDAWLRGHDLAFTKALADRGWIGITWPAEVGGGGRSALARLVLTEELLRSGAPVAAHWIADRQIGPAILRYGSTELRARYLPAIARGEVTFSLGMSETEAGSDLASVRTVAEPVEGGWRLRGSKIWTSHAHRSSHVYVLARTDSTASKHAGLTEFVVDLGARGVTIRPIHDLRGDHHFNEVTFDDVFVPADDVLGTPGDGWRQVTEQLAFERGGMERVLSTYPLLAATIEAAKDPAPYEAEAIGRTAARLATLRRIGWQIAAAMEAGQAPVHRAAMLKDLGTTFERDVNELARTVLEVEPDPDGGGQADLLAQGVLAAPGFTIRGGTTEVLRTIIARSVSGEKPEHHDLRIVADDVLSGRGGDPVADTLPEVWSQLGELGWPGVGVAEELGGSGGGLAELTTLVEATGRHATPVPLAETAWARMLVARTGLEVLDGPATVICPVGDDLTAGGDVLTGAVHRVPWARAARHLVIVGAGAVWMVAADAPGVTRRPGTNLAGEPRDTVVFDRVAADRLGPVDADTVYALGALLRAVQTVGALEAAVDHTVRHVTTREQFGRPLASFQAVGATLAEMAEQLTLAHAAVSAAVAEVRSETTTEPTTDRTPARGAVRNVDPSGSAWARIAAAVAITGEAATVVARNAHQLHGAMGVTREHPLHLVTRRLWSWRDEFGGDRHWARALGQCLLPRGEQAVWDWITADIEDDEREA